MKLYLNDKERSMEFLNLLEVMLSESLTDSKLNLDTTELIKNTNGVIDPVEDFLDYFVEDSLQQDTIDEVRKNWIKNALYAAKGAPQVFEIFQDAFGIKIDYTYNFPVIEVLNFKVLQVSDVILFVKKFKEILYNLLYYTELNLQIKDLILNIIGLLQQTNQIGVRGFVNLNMDRTNGNF